MDEGATVVASIDHLRSAAPDPGEPMAVRVGEVDFPFVWIPSGEFMMGSPPNEPGGSTDAKQHPVTITHGFWMGKYPVTQSQWMAVMGNNPSSFQRKVKTGFLSSRKEALPDHPVENVTWTEADAFCKKLGKCAPQGMTARLPTEAEWEYACRAGTTTALNSGKPITAASGRCANLDEVAWYGANSGGTTHPVGQKKPNAWGLYDMHGNVWEWCGDWYGPYPSGPMTDPTGVSSGLYRVQRGGSWFSFVPGVLLSSGRSYARPGIRVGCLGFRVVLSSSSP